uniref:Uncharacterized protein n=1 Tax=Anguilla anguilla TaxID=7936 RepID=A0A0E9XG75_ANGAN
MRNNTSNLKDWEDRYQDSIWDSSRNNLSECISNLRFCLTFLTHCTRLCKKIH